MLLSSIYIPCQSPSNYYCWETWIYTFITLLDFLGGGEGKPVLSVIDIRMNNHAVIYSKVSNQSVFIILFSQQRERDMRQMLSSQKLGAQEQLETALNTSISATFSRRVWTDISHCMGKESKQQTSEAGVKSLFLQYRAEITLVSGTSVCLPKINSRLMLCSACRMGESAAQEPHPNQEH